MRDIKRYLNGEEEEFCTNQKVAGYDKLFRGLVVKEWIDVNEGKVDFHGHNRVLIKICVSFYHECWKSRYIVLHLEEYKTNILRKQVELMKLQE